MRRKVYDGTWKWYATDSEEEEANVIAQIFRSKNSFLTAHEWAAGNEEEWEETILGGKLT